MGFRVLLELLSGYVACGFARRVDDGTDCLQGNCYPQSRSTFFGSLGWKIFQWEALPYLRYDGDFSYMVHAYTFTFPLFFSLSTIIKNGSFLFSDSHCLGMPKSG